MLDEDDNQPDPWWVWLVLALVLAGIIGGIAGTVYLDEPWPLIISVLSFVIVSGG